MLYLIFFAHWVGDFVCQTREMAERKSNSLYWLSIHVVIYSIVIQTFSLFVSPNITSWILFSLTNFGLHFLVDFFTSKATTYFWQKDNKKAFFTTIGFDQFLHAACLLWTANQFLIV